MAYREFSLADLKKHFGVSNQVQALFEKVQTKPVSQDLTADLEVARVLPVKSEKAKSEMIVTPILVDLLKQNNHFFTIHSGEILNADPQRGLIGECDFILARDTGSFDITAPLLILVEAKKHDIDTGIPQCAAQMIGAQFFNQERNEPISTIYGCVTTADDWLFLKLEDQTLIIDNQKYYLNELGKVLGIFQHIIDYYKGILIPV